MPINDIFLPLVGEPSEQALAAIEKCVAAAADMGAKITALAVEEDILVRPKLVISADLDNAAESEALRSDRLREHGVFASFETARINGSSVGKVPANWTHHHAIDTIVMGAYHHSRLNEIVWGGMTKTVIGQPPYWVMMSH